jgi:rubrerythrin
MATMNEEYRKILQMAIGNEIAAYEFYKGVSEKTRDNSLRSIFLEMAEEEKKHRIFLEGFISGAKPLHFSAVTDYKVSETVEKPKLSVGMKPADAIALAMKEEEEAMRMYQGLADSSTNAEQKQLFLNLAGMERSHKVKLEELYTTMAFPEVW